MRAAASIASSVLASRPSISAWGRCSMPCSLNQARPSTHAFSAFTILCVSSSTVRCMSSQTQPQNVQVALRTTRVLALMAMLLPRSGDRLDLHLDILRQGHAAARGVAVHQGARQRAVGDEQKPRRQVLRRAPLAAYDDLAGREGRATGEIVVRCKGRAAKDLQRTTISPVALRTRTRSLSLTPSRAMSSTFISSVEETSTYSVPSLPAHSEVPWLEERPPIKIIVSLMLVPALTAPVGRRARSRPASVPRA